MSVQYALMGFCFTKLTVYDPIILANIPCYSHLYSVLSGCNGDKMWQFSLLFQNNNHNHTKSYIWLSHLVNFTCFIINPQKLLLSPNNSKLRIWVSNSFLLANLVLQYPHCFMVFTIYKYGSFCHNDHFWILKGLKTFEDLSLFCWKFDLGHLPRGLSEFRFMTQSCRWWNPCCWPLTKHIPLQIAACR